MLPTLDHTAFSRRKALRWLSAGAMGTCLSACGGGGGSTGSASSGAGGSGLVTIPETATPTPTPPAPTPTPTPVVVDESRLMLRELAARRGIAFGTPYPELKLMNAASSSGQLANFMRDQSDLLVNVGFIPQSVEYMSGWYNTAPLQETIDIAAAHGKSWRGHCLLYPLADSANVKATVSASNWRSMITKRFEAIAKAPGVQGALSLDITNEVMDPSDMAGTNGYRPNHWYLAAGPDYLVHAYKEARRLWPNTPLYWCHDQTEQLSGAWHQKMAAVNLKAIEAVKNAGGSIDGYNMQAHLTLRLGFDAARLKAYLDDLTRNLGLKIMIGELDCRTGYSPPTLVDTPAPDSYATADLDRVSADLVKRFLDVVLPYVQSSGRQLICWGLTDVYDPWSPTKNPAERPMPWDKNYQPKPMWTAIQQSLMSLPKA